VRFWARESAVYCSKVQKEKTTTGVAEAAWQEPPVDVLKINFDGAYNADTKSGGWGFAIRDMSGQFCGAGAGRLLCISSAAQAEILACEEAVHAASEWGMTKVIVESDSQNLVRAMQSTDYDRAL
jgi:ribonuclease HI